MAWVVDSVQESVIKYLKTEFAAFDVHEGEIPNGDTVKVDVSGNIKSYITFQFSDIRMRRSGSFSGERAAEYYFTFDAQVVSANPEVSRRTRNRMNDKLIGYVPPHSGEIGKEWGVSNYSFTDPKTKGQVYVSPATFKFSVTAEVG